MILRKMVLVSSPFVVAACLLAPDACSGQDQPHKTAFFDLAKLKSADQSDRDTALTVFTQARKKLIKDLLELAKQKEKKPREYRGTKEFAILLLGEYRALEAVPFCFEHLTYEVEGLGQDDFTEEIYPCLRVLLAIGPQVYDEAWRWLARYRPNDLEIQLFASIVRSIDGEEEGQARLDAARRKAEKRGGFEGPILRENLDRVIRYYKTKKRPI